jgi:type VI secretion system protein ImpG
MARVPRSGMGSLLASAERFAMAYPGLAGALDATSMDPSLERVREGLFFLGATLIDQIQRHEAEGYRALAEVVAPAVTRSFPAATIAQLTARDGGCRRVPAGAEISDGASCRFRLVSDVEVGPLRVEDARITATGGRQALTFRLVATSAAGLRSSVGRKLRLYIDGSRDAASLLLSHVLSHGVRAEITVAARDACPLLVGAYGMRAEEAIAPEPDGPPTAMGFFREYFLLPEKFCFFEVAGITEALQDGDTEARICIGFDAPLLPRAYPAPDALRPNCVPVVNLFRATCEPRIFDGSLSTFPLRVAGLSHNQGGVFAVRSVTATPTTRSADVVVVPRLGRFSSAGLALSFPYAFSTKLVSAPDEEEPHVVLSVTAPRGRKPRFEPHVLSIDVIATNAGHGSQVRTGDLSKPGAGFPADVAVRNIVPTSPHVPAPTGPELARQAFQRAAVPSDDALFNLKSLLGSMVPRHGVDAASIASNLAKIRAIEAMDVTVAIDRERAARGYQAALAIDETPFQGTGDVALFVRLLHATLDAQASANRFFRCEARCTKSGARIYWPPREET